MLTYTPVPGARDEMLSPPPPCPVLKITKLQRMVFLTVNALAFVLQLIAVTIALVATAHAQTSPWETEATRLSQAFTGTIAKGFSLVAIVLGGLMLAFSERRTCLWLWTCFGRLELHDVAVQLRPEDDRGHDDCLFGSDLSQGIDPFGRASENVYLKRAGND
jgi:type IV secretory pathway VirB2 component (pilin)